MRHSLTLYRKLITLENLNKMIACLGLVFFPTKIVVEIAQAYSIFCPYTVLELIPERKNSQHLP